MSVRKKTYWILVCLILASGGGIFLKPYLGFGDATTQADSNKAGEEGAKKEEKSDDRAPVEVAAARTGDISNTVTSTANLRPEREVEVASQSEGVIREVLVEEGEYVQAGQLMCRLDDVQFLIRLESARQKLAQAKFQMEKAGILGRKSLVQVENTREELKRYQQLFSEHLVSEREVAEIRYRLDDLEHDLQASTSSSNELTHRVEELESEIEQIQLEILRTKIEAPFDGFVVERSVDQGRTVKSLDGLFKLGDFSPLLAEVFLSEREAAGVRSGQKALVFSGVDGSKSVEGQVARISPVVDDSTGTVKVTLELTDGLAMLKPGAFVRVDIRTDTHRGALLLPKRAVVEEDGEKIVFVAESDTVKRVPIEIGFESGGDVEILRGVESGEFVVIAGQGTLKDGSKIKLVEKTAGI